ncbi:polysaccharide deacetylase family protein [Myxococcota bacterium]|nr:polysaccharide deacetylase family protein [Myxococcota bacterium]
MNTRIARSYRKNIDEVLAFAQGSMPSFVMRGSDPPDEPPIFCFHEVDSKRFESQLLHLSRGGYRCLGALELSEKLADRNGDGREVALTFDDGTWSFWAHAFPLIRHYGFRAILFVIPSLVPEDDSLHPNLEDVWRGKASVEDLKERGRHQPLCTWREIEIMHQSGVVDIQSHSMTHSRVPISGRIQDFFLPGYPVETYGNVNLPVPTGDNPRSPNRALAWGAPILQSASRMAGTRRYFESEEAVARLVDHVAQAGGAPFFDRRRWRAELAQSWRTAAHDQAEFESRSEMERAILWELSESKRVLEERLEGNQVSHFCYPWFEGSLFSDSLASRAGYETVHYGLSLPSISGEDRPPTLRARRLSEDFLFRLPGPGRVSLYRIGFDRINGRPFSVGSET